LVTEITGIHWGSGIASHLIGGITVPSLFQNLRLKAVLPITAVLGLGLLLFEAATLSLESTARHRVLLVAAGGALAISAVLLVVLAVLVESPLTEMKQTVARIRAGDLFASVSFAKRKDEIGELGRKFNEMVRELRESRVEIESLHRTQMSRAEHLASLGELAAGIAHEVRNPLAGIAGAVEVIGQQLPAGSAHREVLQEVRKEVQRIQLLLSDLLQYARPRPLRFLRSDLGDTIEQAVLLARQQVGQRPIQIEFTKPEDLPPVEHDAALIEQVALNLLVNAIQAMDQAGSIRVRTEIREGLVGFQVADSGRGIAADVLPKIFRPFFTTKGHGTGLGLSLAKGIIEQHGGSIEVQSRLGSGTEFFIWLPAAGAPVAVHAIPA
jgi:signal transduction histidine kinase